MLSQCIKRYTDVPWLPAGSSMELHRASTLPERERITSTHILCFSGNKLLMVMHDKRGWDIPGGHVEPGEEIERSLVREVDEEAAAIAKELRLFALYQLHVPTPPADYRYPHPRSYICCFIGTLERLLPFPAKFETKDRRLFAPDEVRTLEWYRHNKELYEMASRHLRPDESRGSLL